MENLTEKLDTYLLNWWCALPLDAIMEIHMTDIDLNYIDDDKEFQDEIDTLRRENIKILERLNKFRKSLNAHKKYLNDLGYDLNKSKTFKLLDVNTI